MPLPQRFREFVEKYASVAKQATFFNEPMESLDREELLAVIGYLTREGESERKELARQRDFFADMPR